MDGNGENQERRLGHVARFHGGAIRSREETAIDFDVRNVLLELLGDHRIVAVRLAAVEIEFVHLKHPLVQFERCGDLDHDVELPLYTRGGVRRIAIAIELRIVRMIIDDTGSLRTWHLGTRGIASGRDTLRATLARHRRAGRRINQRTRENGRIDGKRETRGNKVDDFRCIAEIPVAPVRNFAHRWCLPCTGSIGDRFDGSQVVTRWERCSDD